jgi:outer membrane immunogenic protein
MRRLIPVTALICLAAPACAADMAARAPVYKAAPLAITDWSGWYLGAHAGYGWGSVNYETPTTGFRLSNDFNGGIAGIHGGYNWQPSSWVYGIEADFDWTGLKGSDAIGGIVDEDRLLAQGSVRGRVGYAWDRLLFYGTAGWAYGDNRHRLSGGESGSDSAWHNGWTAGGGLECAFAPNWAARVEYRYTDYGSANYTFSGGAPRIVEGAKIDSVTAGLTYRFGSR